MNKTISEKKADPVPSKKLLMIVVIFVYNRLFRKEEMD